MSIEAAWYAAYRLRKPPRCRRLSRQPMSRQWEAAIDIAICFYRGEAGYRPSGKNTVTGEYVWLWPQPDSNWWIIPPRVEKRVFAIVQAAIECEIRSGRGQARQEAINRRLEKWRHTGQWRSIASKLFPRH